MFRALPAVFFSTLFALSLTLYVDSASAASLNLLDTMQNSFKSETDKWFTPLETIARRLLLGLAILSLAWNFLQVVIRNGDFQEIVMVLVKHLMTVGLFLAIIINAREWTTAILNGFISAADTATGNDSPDMSAASVLHHGLTLGHKITQLGSAWWEPIVLYPLSLIAVLLYAVIAAYMLLVYAEIYIVTAGGIILLGFAGTDWTLDYARRYLTYCISVGAKLYVLYLVIGIGSQMINTWASDQVLADRATIITVIGVVFVMTVLVVTLPNLIQNVVNGAAPGAGGLAAPRLSAAAATATGAAIARTVGGALRGDGASGATSNLTIRQLRTETSGGGAASVRRSVQGQPPNPAGGNPGGAASGGQPGQVQARRLSLPPGGHSPVVDAIQADIRHKEEGG